MTHYIKAKFLSLRSRFHTIRVLTISDWGSGRLILRNYWSGYYNGFPFFVIDGNRDRHFEHWQFRFGILGFVLVIFNERNQSKDVKV